MKIIRKHWLWGVPLLPLVFFIWLRITCHWTPQTEEDAQFAAIEFVVQNQTKMIPESVLYLHKYGMQLHGKKDGRNVLPVPTSLLTRLQQRFPDIKWIN